MLEHAMTRIILCVTRGLGCFRQTEAFQRGQHGWCRISQAQRATTTRSGRDWRCRQRTAVFVRFACPFERGRQVSTCAARRVRTITKMTVQMIERLGHLPARGISVSDERRGGIHAALRAYLPRSAAQSVRRPWRACGATVAPPRAVAHRARGAGIVSESLAASPPPPIRYHRQHGL